MAYRNTFFRWLFLYSLTFGLTYVLKLFTYLCPETGHCILQRHNMPVWIDRYIWAFRGDTRTLLSRVFQREIAGQV